MDRIGLLQLRILVSYHFDLEQMKHFGDLDQLIIYTCVSIERE